MSSMIERMRARVKERQPTFERDYSVYPFWNLKFGASATLRLLPYNDSYTGAFWSEKITLPMTFTDPDNDSKLIKYSAPCREMYDPSERCPVLVPVRDLYAEEKELRNTGQTQDADKLKRIAGFHWKKPVYSYQGFVGKGFAEEEVPENPIRIFPMNKKLHRLIYDSIFDNEEDPFDALPCGEFTEEDVQAILGDAKVDMSKFEGYNFIIKKLQQGEYADWTTGSGWSKSQYALTEEQLAAIAEHGLHDLSKRLPPRPTDEQYDVLTEMMEVSIQRMLTGENGYWRKEWEEAGFKPYKQRDGSGGTEAKGTTRTTAATSNAGKANGESDTTVDSGEAVSALDRLKAARSKRTEDSTDTVEETPADVAAAADDSPAETPSEQPSANEDLAAKIRARVSQSA